MSKPFILTIVLVWQGEGKNEDAETMQQARCGQEREREREREEEPLFKITLTVTNTIAIVQEEEENPACYQLYPFKDHLKRPLKYSWVIYDWFLSTREREQREEECVQLQR